MDSLVISLRLNCRVSTAACVDVKGTQVGIREELDRLYFLEEKGVLETDSSQ